MNRVLRSLKDKILADKNTFIRTLLISEGFGFCVSLSFVWGYELDKYGSVSHHFGGFLGSLFVALLFAQLAVGLLLLGFYFVWGKENESYSNTENTDEESSEDEAKIKCGKASKRSITERLIQFGIVAAVLFLLWLPIYLAYYPAVFSYDAEAQLYQVISGNYSTHHPLIHTLIMKVFAGIGYDGSGINHGMSAYAICQMVILALMISAGLTIPWKQKRRLSKAWIVILTLFIGIFPVYGILAVSTTKDIFFAGLLFLLFIFLYENEGTIGEYIAIGVIAFLSMLFRNNAVYAIVVSVVLLLLFGIKEKDTGLKFKRERPYKLIITIALSVVMAILILAVLKASLGAESGSPREALSIPIQQMARVKVLHSDELSGELKQNLNALIDDEWAPKYDEHLADPIKERISMKQPKLFVLTWIKLGLKYPADYLDAWLLTVEGSFFIKDTSCNRIYGEGQITGFGYLSTDIRNMPEGFEVKADSKSPMLKAFLEKLVSDNSFEKNPVFRLLFAPALYIWIVLFFVYLNILNREYEKNIALIIPIIYFLTLLLSPAILVRYMFPYFLIAPVLIGILITQNRKEK